MTEFRSKGKGRNRKVFPINPRKPYGVSRELAAEEVQALRDKGQKARLIKTNRKKELYGYRCGFSAAVKNRRDLSCHSETTSKSFSIGRTKFCIEFNVLHHTTLSPFS